MEDTNSLIEQRKAKLKSLEAKGIFPFQNKFTPDIGAGEVLRLLETEDLVTASTKGWTGFEPDLNAYCKCYCTSPHQT